MKKLLAIAAALALSVTLIPGTTANAALPKSVDTCKGVWVVLDTGSSTTKRCATKYSTGIEALKSAGFKVKTKKSEYGTFVCQIEGLPKTCDIANKDYWGNFQSTKTAAGTWGDWAYATTGADSSKPSKNVAEGWRYEKNLAMDPPSVTPPKQFTSVTASVSGTAKVGKTLKVKASASATAKYTYQWLRSGKSIKGATKPTYKLTSADKGKKISVKVTAKKSGYSPASVVSKAKKIK
ncbi:MAG: hypothetical protein LBR21_09040 [Propionibacteriaceae bacterium]|jgi:hypothetical protein|nr:hypothetical protein [Propionibacteriaceae bacterium]